MVERLRGRAAVAQRKRRLERTHYLCERCAERGVTRVADVVDHVKPLALGGDDSDDNTRNLCNDCHYEVGGEQFGYRVKQRITLSGWPEEG